MTRQTMLLSALGAVLVIALWWLFLFSPGQETLATLDEEITAAQAEAVSLETRITRLEAVRAQAPELEAGISNLLAIVPEDPALPGLLRQLQAAADDAGVELTTVSTTRPAVVDELLGLHRIDVSIVFTGSYFQTVDFMRRIEDPAITARGITFNSLSAAPLTYPELSVAVSGAAYAVLEPVPDPQAVPVPDETAETTEDADAATEEVAS